MKQTKAEIVRFTRGVTCPVCGGSDDAPRGQGRRCHGFQSGSMVHCSREEFGSACPFNPDTKTYSHLLEGACLCGHEHSRPAAGASARKKEVDRVYSYCDLDDQVVHQTVRYRNPKSFGQRRPGGKGGYIYKGVFEGITPILYRLKELTAADPEQTVYIVEGEKDADRLIKLGLVATTNPMGAGKWKRVDASPLDGRHCVVIPDADEPGYAHANQVAAERHGKAASVRVVMLPLLPEKGDVSDWLDTGGGSAAMLGEIADEAPLWEPPAAPGPFPAHGKRSVAPGAEAEIGDDVSDPVGEVDRAAFYGPLGQLALATQPETEANALFVLLHLMAFFGAACGRLPHFVVSASKHHLNLFVGLIGVSGFGRKGTASHVAKEIWRKINPTFTLENISDGLNSGAGLLYHLRDPTEKSKNNPADEGVDDKKRVFLESELSSVLMQGHRENDPLLGHLRKFFDGEPVVRSNTKDPTKVSEGHVTIVGHCTPMDLEIHLSDLDKANGTANRFLWLYGVRSKLLARGGDVFTLLETLKLEIQAIEFAIEDARKVARIQRDADVEARWDKLYREFNEIPPGRLGAFFVRAPTIVLRMAAIFALADRETAIRSPHLDAALAIWQHSARSLRWVFRGDTDYRSEKLLDALKASPEGLTKRQITHEVFGRNLEADTVDELLLRLLAHQAIVRHDTKPGPRGGRPGIKYRIKVW